MSYEPTERRTGTVCARSLLFGVFCILFGEGKVGLLLLICCFGFGFGYVVGMLYAI